MEAFDFEIESRTPQLNAICPINVTQLVVIFL